MEEEQLDEIEKSIEEAEKKNEENDDLAGGMDEDEEDHVLDNLDSQALVDSLWNLLKEITEPYDYLWTTEQC